MGEAKRRYERNKMQWTAGSHYTLIVEWLGDDDRKTGSELADRLRLWGSQVVLRCCRSSADVLAALYDALENLRTDGLVPVVHIEAHGISAPEHGDDSGLEGPGVSVSEKRLLWTAVAPLLGELNIATRFQLLLVGAACYGLTALDMFDVNKPAPFAALVGFGGTVHQRSLFESMVELYRQLLLGSRRSIPEAVQAANRELSHSAGEMLITTSFRAFAEGVIRTYARHELEPNYRRSENQRLARERLRIGRPTTPEQMARLHSQIALRRCQQAVQTWFAYKDIPENRDRYRIDVEKIFRQELSKHRQRKIG